MHSRGLTKRDCLDILITAIEGGIGYWSKVDPIERSEDGDYLVTDVYVTEDQLGPDGITETPERVGFAYTDPYFGTMTFTRIGTLTPATIRKGFEAMEAEGGHYAAMVGGAEDPGDIDAEIADVIVQFGLWGKTIYG